MPFLLCFFTSALPGALLLSGKSDAEPDLLLFAVCMAVGILVGLVFFLVSAHREWFARRSQIIYMIAAAALVVYPLLALIIGHSPLWMIVLAEIASSFLFGFVLIFAEERSNHILHIGLGAVAAFAVALVLAILFTRTLPSILEGAGIIAGLLFFVLAFFERQYLFPNAVPFFGKSDVPPPVAGGEIGKTRDERLQHFAEHYRLTPREADVLRIVVDNECTLKEVAYTLSISERMVQRYMTSIYQKTDTQSRIGLSLKYFNK